MGEPGGGGSEPGPGPGLGVRQPGPRDFRTRVIAAVERAGPLCAGIDPSEQLMARWGLPDDASGMREFAFRCIEAFDGVVPVLKFQVAFFERHGAAGLRVLEEAITSARSAGSIVIADAKRSDIGSTVAAYASAWLAPDSTLRSDAVTVVPYFGLEALGPVCDLARAVGAGVFVVVRSSNPGGRWLQTALVPDAAAASGVTGAGAPDIGAAAPAEGAKTVEDTLLAAIADLNAASGGVGHVGAVVGATLTPSAFPLASLGGIVLTPGYGAQGGTASGLARLFADCDPGTVLANVSRSLLDGGPEVGSLRSHADRLRQEIADALRPSSP